MDDEVESSVEETEAEKFQGHSAACRGRLISSCVTRLFFLLLLMADLCWALYCTVRFTVLTLLLLASFCKVASIKERQHSAWLLLRRALVCGFCLLITLVSPSFGIMVACTYFLMYDKDGIQEVVPSSLRAQFPEMFKSF